MRELKVINSMYPNWRLQITDDGRVTWVGVERGPLTLHHEDTRYLVLKEAGHQWYWNQYQGAKYEPAKFIVFKKLQNPEAGGLTLIPEVEFYVKEQKHEVHRRSGTG